MLRLYLICQLLVHFDFHDFQIGAVYLFVVGQWYLLVSVNIRHLSILVRG